MNKIILIVIDALRFDTAKYFFPYFNINFTHHYTSNNWTLPTTARLLTGIMDNGLNHYKKIETKVVMKNLKNGLKVPTIGKYLKESGWIVNAKTEGLYLSDYFGFGKKNEWDNWVVPTEKEKNATGNHLKEPIFHHNKKEFLFLHDYYLHDYFRETGIPPDKKITGPKGEEIGVYSWRGYDQLNLWEISYWKRAAKITEFINWIPKSEAIVILTSDHGESFCEFYGDNMHTGCHLTEAVAHIPLLIHWPGLPTLRIGQFTRDIDVAPTILEMAGIKKKLDGISLVPIIKEGKIYKSTYTGQYVHGDNEIWQFDFSPMKKDLTFIREIK